MKQRVIQHLPTISAHVEPIYYSVASLPKIITSEYLPPHHCPNKKEDPPWGLHTPNAFTKEIDRIGTPQSIIERMNIKLHILLQPPPRPISILFKRNMKIQKMMKSSHQIQLATINSPR